jgi:hypothetical protein
MVAQTVELKASKPLASVGEPSPNQTAASP